MSRTSDAPGRTPGVAAKQKPAPCRVSQITRSQLQKESAIGTWMLRTASVQTCWLSCRWLWDGWSEPCDRRAAKPSCIAKQVGYVYWQRPRNMWHYNRWCHCTCYHADAQTNIFWHTATEAAADVKHAKVHACMHAYAALFKKSPLQHCLQPFDFT